MHSEVKTKRDATGARDPKSAKRHGVARELKMGDSWANGLPKIQRTWRKSGRVKSVDVNVNPTRNSICISAEDTVGPEWDRFRERRRAFETGISTWQLRFDSSADNVAVSPLCNLDCLRHQRQQRYHRICRFNSRVSTFTFSTPKY
ncbi:hypothetical protein ALC62_11731 [Cyphomyrmex costatus]|uniref:Uncharacterized protein n=1 Tax=Cyphomyrmex costatus TaxID=456900 RepID=A0A195C998_9HYME|nr:hypothetical protein ALC62_11731 [Cyphomyrmex costatus]